MAAAVQPLKNTTQNCFVLNAVSQWLRLWETRVGARFFRLKYGQLKCDQRARGTRSFQKRWSAARQLTFPVHWLRFSSRYILLVSCKNCLTKARVYAMIFPASERVSLRSNQIFRGIAQLVEQRSPKPRAEGSSPSAPAIRKTPENGLNKPFSGVLFLWFFHGARSENALLML